jgi:hypothetical protein
MSGRRTLFMSVAIYFPTSIIFLCNTLWISCLLSNACYYLFRLFNHICRIKASSCVHHIVLAPSQTQTALNSLRVYFWAHSYKIYGDDLSLIPVHVEIIQPYPAISSPTHPRARLWPVWLIPGVPPSRPSLRMTGRTHLIHRGAHGRMRGWGPCPLHPQRSSLTHHT